MNLQRAVVVLHFASADVDSFYCLVDLLSFRCYCLIGLIITQFLLCCLCNSILTLFWIYQYSRGSKFILGLGNSSWENNLTWSIVSHDVHQIRSFRSLFFVLFFKCEKHQAPKENYQLNLKAPLGFTELHSEFVECLAFLFETLLFWCTLTALIAPISAASGSCFQRKISKKPLYSTCSALTGRRHGYQPADEHSRAFSR